MKSKNTKTFAETKSFKKSIDEINQELKKAAEEQKHIFSLVTKQQEVLSEVDKHMYESKIREIDLYINISLNLVSFSVALLVAFISIPQLEGSFLPPFLGFILSLVFLIVLIRKRRKESKKLELKLLIGMEKMLDSLLFKSEFSMRGVANSKKFIDDKLAELERNYNSEGKG